MRLAELTNEQRRQLIDVAQAFTAWRNAAHKAVPGSLRWVTRKGMQYLYRKSGKSERSLGRRSRATEAMGVRDVRFLGGAGRYRDSGMMDTPANKHARAFWNADLEEAAGHLVEVIREIRPQVVVTYDTNGSYGHPDHIQSHRVTMRAVELANEAGVGPDKVYWTAIPMSVMVAGMQAFAGSPSPSGISRRIRSSVKWTPPQPKCFPRLRSATPTARRIYAISPP